MDVTLVDSFVSCRKDRRPSHLCALLYAKTLALP